MGYDNIDVEAATRRGVLVTNTPDVLTNATADIAFTLILASARRVVEANEFLRSGDWVTWHPDLLLGQDVSEAVLGIVGMGKIGRAVAKRAAGFSMKILFFNRSPRPDMEKELGARQVPLDELLRESDFVSLHCPLSAETKGLIGERELRMMKKSAILINTSRGPVVDQKALYRACSEQWIWGGGARCFRKGACSLDEPLLRSLKTSPPYPISGCATIRAREGMARKAARKPPGRAGRKKTGRPGESGSLEGYKSCPLRRCAGGGVFFSFRPCLFQFFEELFEASHTLSDFLLRVRVGNADVARCHESAAGNKGDVLGLKEHLAQFGIVGKNLPVPAFPRILSTLNHT